MNAGGRPYDIKDRSFSFALDVIRICESLGGMADTKRILGRQLLRAGTSVGANIEEAQAGQSRADFVSKYSVALKEARETIYWLRLLNTNGDTANGAVTNLMREADEIARIIGSIIVNTKKGGIEKEKRKK